MKTAGMIAGLGPETTVDYYRAIIAEYQRRKPDRSAPALIMNSLDVEKGLGMLRADRPQDLTDYLVAAIERLERAGCDFGFIAANTPHIVFDEVQERVRLPLLSIVAATFAEASRQRLKHPALLGTGFTMKARFYPDVFTRGGIPLVLPAPAEQDYIHDRYMNELLKGVLLDETRAGLVEIMERIKRDEEIDGLIFAGTELPLILRAAGDMGVPVLDTTLIHVNAIVDRILS